MFWSLERVAVSIPTDQRVAFLTRDGYRRGELCPNLDRCEEPNHLVVRAVMTMQP
jgi:hypothetical protein